MRIFHNPTDKTDTIIHLTVILAVILTTTKWSEGTESDNPVTFVPSSNPLSRSASKSATRQPAIDREPIFPSGGRTAYLCVWTFTNGDHLAQIARS